MCLSNLVQPWDITEYDELLYIMRLSGVSTYQPLPWLGLRGRSNTDVSTSWDVVKGQGVFRVLGLCGEAVRSQQGLILIAWA
jgi:hypothetical protein